MLTSSSPAAMNMGLDPTTSATLNSMASRRPFDAFGTSTNANDALLNQQQQQEQQQGGAGAGAGGQGQGVPQDVDRLLRVLRHNMLPIQCRAGTGDGNAGGNDNADNAQQQDSASASALSGSLPQVPSFNAAGLNNKGAASDDSELLKQGLLMGNANQISLLDPLPTQQQQQQQLQLQQQALAGSSSSTTAAQQQLPQQSQLDQLDASGLVSMLSKPKREGAMGAGAGTGNIDTPFDAALLGCFSNGAGNLLGQPSTNNGLNNGLFNNNLNNNNFLGGQQAGGNSNAGLLAQMQQQVQQQKQQLQQQQDADAFNGDDSDSKLFKALAANLAMDGGAANNNNVNANVGAGALSVPTLPSLPGFGGQGFGAGGFPNDAITPSGIQALAQQQQRRLDVQEGYRRHLQQGIAAANLGAAGLGNNAAAGLPTGFLPDAASAALSLNAGISFGAAAAAAGNSDNEDNLGVFGKNSGGGGGGGGQQPLRFKPFHEEKWSRRLEELRAFRSVHGNCLVPHTYPRNPQLARWVKRQRRQYKLLKEGKVSTMTPERAVLLEQVGFVWDSHEASWREKIAELRGYRARHGNCLVPSSYRSNPSLAVWVKCQRRQYKLYQEGKPSAMNAERIMELESEGFCWEVRALPPAGGGSSAEPGTASALSDSITRI